MELKEAISKLQDDPYTESFAWLILYSYAMKCDLLYVLRSDLQWRTTGFFTNDVARYANTMEYLFNSPGRWADFSVLSWVAQDSTLWQVTTKDGLIRELVNYKELYNSL